MVKLQSSIPEGPLAEKWSNYKSNQNLVNPANKRKLDVIVVGTGLAGASAAASSGRNGIQSKILLLSGQSQTSTQYCRTGRYQCSQELSE